ncbi:Secreted peptide [Flavobacterium terrigena]
MIVLPDHEAVTPGGKFIGVPIPVAPAVVCVIEVVNAEFTHNVGVDEAAVTVFSGVTEIVPVASTVPQPPVNGIV